MKSFIRGVKVFLVWVFAWAWFIGAPLSSSIALVGCTGGCKSTTKNTYKASGVTHIAATAALRGWNEYLGREYAAIAANTDTNKAAKQQADLIKKEEQVQAAWGKYQATQIVLLTVTQEFSKIDPNEPHDPTAWDRVTQAALAATAAAADIIALLEKFGIKS